MRLHFFYGVEVEVDFVQAQPPSRESFAMWHNFRFHWVFNTVDQASLVLTGWINM